ncbi:hypothetical protein [Tardiphaga sp.]|uniref:hypothetical protein n=1 Tax=Tardiphaga sp. TaxID=1926292 RepID=UPI002636D33F|nr:hypothetical protein [Tardiphaga sp.]MDB5616603.1 hypothetical protein [Tardiphaga sp.]
MPLSLSSIERIKLGATACNTLGTALITVGVFTPLALKATSMEVISPERWTLIYWWMGISIFAALLLLVVGQMVLKLLELNDV